MDYQYFGRSGIRVSQICLGTMTFGNEADEAESFAIMDSSVEAGINFFDTADIYNRGLTEEIVGRWLKERRDSNVLVASKVHFPTGDDVNARGNSRYHILKGVEASLKRLQLDALDVLYLHHWDDATPLEETLSALDDLVHQGKVHYVAVSNFSAWQTMKAMAAAPSSSPIVAIQPMYNLVKRQAEVELLPLASSEGLAVCPYSPMGAGLLTGKYQRKEQGRIDVNPMYKERYKDDVYMETSDRFVAYAEEHGYDPAALSVAWVRAHPAVTSTIIGARNRAQLDTALSSQSITLSPEDREAISALSPAPPTATDRERESFIPFPTKK